MSHIEAVLFTKWVKDTEGTHVPNAISGIYAWAMANGEQLPDGPYGRYEDITGQANVHQRILDDLAVFVAKVEMTVPTAQHFASDPRIWTLGYRQLDDDGEVMSSNWNTTLTTEERQQAVSYITNNSNITAAQLVSVFDVDDTRYDIGMKLMAFFKE